MHAVVERPPSAPGNSTNTGPRAVEARLGDRGRGFREEVHVERGGDPADRHSATRARCRGDRVVDSTPPSAGSSRPRKRSRSRSSARPRNIVIARWAWALTRPGSTIAASAVDGPPGVDQRNRWADVGDRRALDHHRGVAVHGARSASIVTTVAPTMARSACGHVIPSAARGSPREQRDRCRSPAASPAAMTSAPSIGTSLMPAARFVASDTPEDLHPHVAGGDRLQHGRHADEVAADRAGHADLGRRLEVRPVEADVHAVGEVGVDGAGDARAGGRCRGRSGRRSGSANGAGGLAPVSGERPVRLMWSVIRTGWPIGHSRRSEPAPLVSTIVRQPASGGGADAVGDDGRVVALVEVDRGRGTRARARPPSSIDAHRRAVAGRRRRREAGQLGERRRSARRRARPRRAPSRSRARRRRRNRSMPVRDGRASAAAWVARPKGSGVEAHGAGSYDPARCAPSSGAATTPSSIDQTAAPARRRVARGRATSTR